jgi:hypothetical protein
MDLSKALGPLTKKFIWEYTTTSSISIFEIKSLLIYALQKLLTALYEVFLCTLVLFIYILLILAKVSVIIFPFVQNLSKLIIEYHYTLTWTDIALETTILSIILIFLIFKNRIMVYWHRLEKSVSAKFRYMVRLVPHVLFFTFALIFGIVGQKILYPFVSFYMLPLISVALPTVRTAYFVRKYSDDLYLSLYNNIRDQLLLWIVLGAYHAFATFLGQLPFSRMVSSYLSYVREVLLVILVWIQISPFFTKLAFEASSPALKYVASKIPASDIGYQQSVGMLSALRYMNVLSKDQESLIKSVMQDGTALLIAIIFICTPTPIAYIGVVIIAFLFPIFRTYRHIHESDEVRNSPVKRRRDSASNEEMSANLEKMFRWLRYWVCLGGLWLLKIYFGFWPSILMLISLWLQHSYFDGSKKLVDTFIELSCALRARHERIRQERETHDDTDGADHVGIDASEAMEEDDDVPHDDSIMLDNADENDEDYVDNTKTN